MNIKTCSDSIIKKSHNLELKASDERNLVKELLERIADLSIWVKKLLTLKVSDRFSAIAHKKKGFALTAINRVTAQIIFFKSAEVQGM